MNLGIVVATDLEKKPFIEVFGKPTVVKPTRSYEVMSWSPVRVDSMDGDGPATWCIGDIFFNNEKPDLEIYLVESGIGEIAAASATQYLIDVYAVDKIVNYGVAGGLTESLPAKTVGIVEKIYHYDMNLGPKFSPGEYLDEGVAYLAPDREAFDFDMFNIERFVCASADKVVLGGEPKRTLRRDFQADICEMEAAGVVRTCNRNNIPVSFIKAVSDGVDEDVEAFTKNVHDAALVCAKILAKAIL